MAEHAGPLDLPRDWVHAEKPPSWDQLGGLVAFVRWRRTDWPSLERLHALHQATREEQDLVVLGLHHLDEQIPARRVLVAQLARGTHAPTGLIEDELALAGGVGSVALVAEGEILEVLDRDVDEGTVVERMRELSTGEEARWQAWGDAPGPWPLAFPSDLAVSGTRLAIADTGHNRVLVARPSGEILHVIGDGVPELRDGAIDEARFEYPRGVCWRDEELLVADTGNDTVRSVDPARGTVQTLARCPSGSLPAGLACTEDGEAIVTLAGEDRLARLGEEGLEALSEGGEIAHPVDAVWLEQDLLAAGLGEAAIARITPGASDAIAWRGMPLVEPTGLAAGEGVSVADPATGEINELSLDGQASRQVFAGDVGPVEPVALAWSGDELLVAGGGGHHVWQLDPAGEAAPDRIPLTESPLSLAEHIRLDPVEMAPGGRLALTVSYLSGEREVAPERVDAPRARGPVRALEIREGPLREEGRVRTELVGEVAASGNLRIRWALTGGELGHEAAWDLPIVVRPGAEDRLRLALSTSPP